MLYRFVHRLIEKLKIHCEDRKAEFLDKNVKKFLSLPAFESKESGQVCS